MQEQKKYDIEESHKYPGSFNIYDAETGTRVAYFCYDDDKNEERAIAWVKKNTMQEPTLNSETSTQLSEEVRNRLLIPIRKLIIEVANTAEETQIYSEELLTAIAQELAKVEARARQEERAGIVKWFKSGLSGEWNGKQIAKMIEALSSSNKDTL